MNVIDTTGMSREEWLVLRRQSIGASDAPVIAGLSKYKSRFQLWLEKTGQAEPTEAGEQARWGLRLEDDIIEELQWHGVEILGKNTQRMIRHPTIPWMTSTVDAFDVEEKGWQLKATSKHLSEDEPPPADWGLQVHQEMMCAGHSEWGIAAFVGPRLLLRKWHVPFDPEIGEGYLQLATEFWNHVETRTPPTEFGPQDAAVLLRHYRAIDDDIIVTEDTRLRELSEQYEIAIRVARFQSDLADQLKAALLARMQTACAMRVGPYLMKRSQVNVKAHTPKPREASSYTKFSFSNTEREDS